MEIYADNTSDDEDKEPEYCMIHKHILKDKNNKCDLCVKE